MSKILKLSCSISFPHSNNTLIVSLSLKHSAILQIPFISIPLFLRSSTCKVWLFATPCAIYLAPLEPKLLQSNYNLRNLHSLDVIKCFKDWAASTFNWLAPKSNSIILLFSNNPCRMVYNPSYLILNLRKLMLSRTLLFLIILLTWKNISCPTSLVLKLSNLIILNVLF